MALLHSGRALPGIAAAFHPGLAAAASARARQRPRLPQKIWTRNTCPLGDWLNFARHLQN
ncbi:GOT2 isoform 6 [Pongo abelii]|uniref:GOT2 isoform 6 n=1 Tax=Pongo abelii TaxID=9601 RepID=A0A2J8VZT8_PONAB|nr:GOT2 isoform 6 [Pongo abelii]